MAFLVETIEQRLQFMLGQRDFQIAVLEKQMDDLLRENEELQQAISEKKDATE